MLTYEQIEAFYPEPLRPYKVHILREYLQYKILEIIFRSKFSARLAFMGGTCLHIVHGIPRFSEDLDFDNDGMNCESFTVLASIIKKALLREGYNVEVKTVLKGTYRAYVGFTSVLQQSGLTGHRNEKMHIQVDTEPQHFSYQKEFAILNKFEVFCRVRTVPIGILLSQKILCILTRPRPLGRDFFDASFLIGRTTPDINYLKEKTGIGSLKETKEQLLTRCSSIDLNQLSTDVAPFLINPADTERILFFPALIKEKL